MSNLDEALERFQIVDLEYAGGLANHGPMAADALESLGHQALIPALVDVYVPRLPLAEEGSVIAEAERAGARGDVARRFDWVATFEAELGLAKEGSSPESAVDWRGVVEREVPALLPGLFAAAGHGLLRTTHAIRMLEREVNELRLRELARGLAYWACRYQSLPGDPGRHHDEGSREGGASGNAVAPIPFDVIETLARIPRIPPEASRAGLFFEVARQLDDDPAFADAISAMPLPRSLDPSQAEDLLTQTCRAAASAYLAHPDRRVGFVHAVTIPHALRTLLPYLPSQARRPAIGHVIQAVAALIALFDEPGSEAAPLEDTEVDALAKDWAEIRYRAACSAQEHAIKMAAACWAEDRLRPDPVLCRAAADAALNIEGRGSVSAC